MNNSVNSNIYSFDAVRVLGKYKGFAQGDANCTIVVSSERGSSSAARDAICKSVDRLGFGSDACAWICLHDGDGKALLPEELLEFVEGIDPISMVAADSASAEALARAYRIEVEVDALARANGRNVVTFRNFEGMLNDQDSKQRAWSLLKRL